VSRTDARRAGILVLVVLFAGGLVLARAPGDLGAVRLAGVSLLWWYSALVAPGVAVALAVALLLRGPRP
jgi:hypothetical protein